MSNPPPDHATTKAYLQIHFCVLLWGVTAILGKLITLPSLPLVWWRMLMVAGVLALLPKVWRSLARIPLRQIGIYALIGALVSLHWLTFYGAIKLSNASVAVTAMAFGPVFLAVIEPLIAGRRIARSELALGIAVIPGVALVVGGVDSSMHLGFAVGVLSAFLVSIFGALNKRYVHQGDPLTVTALELGAGTLCLTLLAPLMPWIFPSQAGALFALPSNHDLILLFVLAMGCTLLPFALSLVALRQISAFSAQLAVNLEPIYAIVLAMLLLGEQRELSLTFYTGVAILLLAVIGHPLLTRSKRKPGAQEVAL
ncbi:MAG: DMT family transporter [Xanthomonadales bacterium]|nr:DMT family transporter [Xanthomonadales bacterium]